MLLYKRFLELYKLIVKKKDPYLTLSIYIKKYLGLFYVCKLIYRVNKLPASLLLLYCYIMCTL